MNRQLAGNARQLRYIRCKNSCFLQDENPYDSILASARTANHRGQFFFYAGLQRAASIMRNDGCSLRYCLTARHTAIETGYVAGHTRGQCNQQVQHIGIAARLCFHGRLKTGIHQTDNQRGRQADRDTRDQLLAFVTFQCWKIIVDVIPQTGFFDRFFHCKLPAKKYNGFL